MHKERKNRLLLKLIGSSIFAYAFTSIIIFVRTYIYLYSQTNGITLPNGRVVGADFVCFYAAGKLFLQDPQSVYSFLEILSLEQEILAGKSEGALVFVYPPLVALLFSSLSKFSLLTAYFVWLGFIVLLTMITLLIVLKSLHLPLPVKALVFTSCLAFPPLSVDSFGSGQTSAIALFIFGMVFVLQKAKHEVLAGMVFSLSYYKPPLFALFLLFALLERQKQFLLGFAVSAIALIAATLWIMGFDGFVFYLVQASKNTYGTELLPGVELPANQAVGLFAVLSYFFGEPLHLATPIFVAIVALTTLRVISLSAKTKKDAKLFDLYFALKIILSLYCSLQMAHYDLSILLLPITLIVAFLWNTTERRGSSLLFAEALFFVSVFGLFFEAFYPMFCLGRSCLMTAFVPYTTLALGAYLLLEHSSVIEHS